MLITYQNGIKIVSDMQCFKYLSSHIFSQEREYIEKMILTEGNQNPAGKRGRPCSQEERKVTARYTQEHQIQREIV